VRVSSIAIKNKKMLKKILLTILLTAALFGPMVFSVNMAFADTPATAPSTTTPPSSDIKSSQFMFDVGAIQQVNIGSTTKQNWIRQGINFLFGRAISIMAGTIGSVAVLIMVLGGFMMITSAGDQTKYDKGKNYLIKAGKGIIFVLGAYILVTTVQLLIKSIFQG
jgi:hypothetical protein